MTRFLPRNLPCFHWDPSARTGLLDHAERHENILAMWGDRGGWEAETQRLNLLGKRGCLFQLYPRECAILLGHWLHCSGQVASLPVSSLLLLLLLSSRDLVLTNK
uniref:Uncharacterized protein n=1 Tax=Sphaerodactylus townsendi TaxID=933632 RepID=A0ACB8EJ18_9SAUR